MFLFFLIAVKTFKYNFIINDVIPVTLLSDYEFCQRKIFLDKVLKIAAPPKDEVIKDIIRHKVFDLINKEEQTVVESIKKRPSYSQILDKYKDSHADILRKVISDNKQSLIDINASLIDFFKKSWPMIVRESTFRAENLFNFVARHEVYSEELWNQLTPKMYSEVNVQSENLMLRGAIDRVEKYPDKKLLYEIKTGRAPDRGVWPSHKLQLAAYAMIMRELGENVRGYFITYLDVNQSRELIVNSFLEERVLKTRDAIINILEKRELPEFTENKNKCNSCSLKEKCYDNDFVKKKVFELLGK